jgi:predicted nucleotidyltransferase
MNYIGENILLRWRRSLFRESISSLDRKPFEPKTSRRSDFSLTTFVRVERGIDMIADSKSERHGVSLPVDRIAEICRKYDVVELSVFGSVLREDFGPESDVDFLAVFRRDDYGPWMSKVQELERELGALVGREVDVVAKDSILQSENWIRKNHILSSAKVVYGS